ncbi:TetR/AcrR family transcriptional regulator [Oligosphaera ethanolica]|jgi:AcrR family transcriptional regulator|uniref:AcrR family transcriptional regulator n=1 Tax=Oligosphaera ethanolica TaxID=760260 RepID=A0AAE3VK93_9BACT|nr:TetR/AcrR family transcriptional regulator [Oligosphaera ethanolica]MDQ0291664.1 AcrR family transcriptional regulator [Oligosphaera ethanolica]
MTTTIADEQSDGLSRKERERLLHRADILAAGERVFASKGFHLATIEEIAREAEFSVGTIYNFFSGKDALYEEVIRFIVESCHNDFTRLVLPENDPQTAINLLIDLRVQQYEQHQGLFHIVLESLPTGHFNPANVLPEDCRKYHENYFQSLCDIFARGRAQGLFSDEAPLSLALIFEGVINTFVAYWSKKRSGQLSPHLVRDLKRVVFRALGCEERTVSP